MNSGYSAGDAPVDRIWEFCCASISNETAILTPTVFHSLYLGEFTPCFEDILIVSAVHLVFIVMLSVRLNAIRSNIGLVLRAQTAQRIKIAIASFCTLAPLFTMIIRIGSGRLVGYQAVSLLLSFVSWALVTVVLFLERRRFIEQGRWILPFLFVFAAFAYGVKLRSVFLFAEIGEKWYTGIYVATFAGVILLVVLSAAVKPTTATGDHAELNEVATEGPSRLADISWPKYSASIVSQLLFQWLQPLVKRGYKAALEEHDVWQLDDRDASTVISPKFEDAWQKQILSRNPSLLKALWVVFGKSFVRAGFPKLLNDASQFVGPLLLQALIRFTTDSTIPDYMGYAYAAAIFIGTMIGAIGENIYFDKVMTVGMHLRTALVTGIYRKSLRLSNNARQKHSVGALVNMMENDTNRLTMLVQNLHLLWSSPLRIIVSLGFLFAYLGIAAIAGVLVLVLLVPAQSKLVKQMQKLRRKITQHTDKRLSLTSEIISGMKVIKFYAWERSFLGKVSDVRKEELASLRNTAYIRCINFLIMSIGPVFVSVATFTMFGIMYAITNKEEHRLTAAKAFTALSLLNVLRYPLIFFPSVVSSIADARVSVQRIEELLRAEETEEVSEDRVEGTVNHGVDMQGADFAWSSTASIGLQNISFTAPTGSLTIVVGGTGSGKSSLLSAVLGDMVLMRGERDVRGRIAYVAQTSWIFNASLKDNVIFGRSFDSSRFRTAVQVSALERDLDLLVAAEETELGERGGNLSGGQRQRVSIARAVYSDAELYIFDDPLSALDSKVGRFVFEKCINGHLSRRTRILATNQLQYATYADRILVMKDGCIAEQGTYRELMASQGSLFASMMHQYGADEHESDDASTPAAAVATPDADADAAKKESSDVAKKKKPVAAGAGQLVMKEERDTGGVSFAVYLAYLAAAGGKRLGFFAVIALITMQIVKAVTNWWLSYWSSNGDSHSIAFYLSIYAALSVALALVQLASSLQFTFGGLSASDILHHKMIVGVVRSPMSFFDSTPLGRIMNRFTKDLTNVDNNLPAQLELFIRGLFDLLGTVAVIGATTPYFLVVVVPVVVIFLFVQAYFRCTTRELKRLDSISRSPIFAHFSETLNGISTIRAYVALDNVAQQNAARVDHNQRFYYASISCNRWLSIRLEFLGGSLVLAAAMFAVVARRAFQDQAGLVGLSLGYALQITSLLNMIIRLFTETENNFNSVERVNAYVNLQSEAPAVIDSNRPDDSWPSKGRIQFQDVVMRYRPAMPPVLRGITFEIRGGEKIGVCGRTGAGKSSLFQALFRIVEAEGGQVLIDGVDVQKIGLDDLRSRLAIIPQEPILFAGTMKYNLDPFDTSTDDELWSVLTRAHLHTLVKNLPGQLQGQVSENGENFSVGQRQMICLARAMLRKAKILVLDEATASVDVETDHLIQRTIREEFKSATTLTIAHRLNTIIDSDRVLVLDAGKAIEYGTPHELLSNRDGVFSSLVDDTGPTTSRHLRDIAAGVAPAIQPLHPSASSSAASPTVAAAAGESVAKFQEVRRAFALVSRAISELEEASLMEQLEAASMTRDGWRSQLIELYAELAANSVRILFHRETEPQNQTVLPHDVL